MPAATAQSGSKWVSPAWSAASCQTSSSGCPAVKSATGVLRMTAPLLADRPPLDSCAASAAPR